MKKNNSGESLKPISVKHISLDLAADNILPTVSSVVVKGTDPISGAHAFIYGFIVEIDGVNYSFKINTQGLLELNSSGEFKGKHTLV